MQYSLSCLYTLDFRQVNDQLGLKQRSLATQVFLYIVSFTALESPGSATLLPSHARTCQTLTCQLLQISLRRQALTFYTLDLLTLKEGPISTP